MKNIRKQGISIMGIIVFIGLIALIVWGINYLLTKDYVVVREPIPGLSDNTANNTAIAPTSTSTISFQNASSTAAVATSTPTSPPVSQTSSALTVTFTDKGFSPAILTIKKGDTVTFVNNSSKKVWVASNPFPTSSDYPAFNEKAGLDIGDSWSFTFTKVGTWFYHNHYSPGQGAKIVVSP